MPFVLAIAIGILLTYKKKKLKKVLAVENYKNVYWGDLQAKKVAKLIENSRFSLYWVYVTVTESVHKQYCMQLQCTKQISLMTSYKISTNHGLKIRMDSTIS